MCRLIAQVKVKGNVKIEVDLSPVRRLDQLMELKFADKLDAKLFERP